MATTSTALRPRDLVRGWLRKAESDIAVPEDKALRRAHTEALRWC